MFIYVYNIVTRCTVRARKFTFKRAAVYRNFDADGDMIATVRSRGIDSAAARKGITGVKFFRPFSERGEHNYRELLFINATPTVVTDYTTTDRSVRSYRRIVFRATKRERINNAGQ